MMTSNRNAGVDDQQFASAVTPSAWTRWLRTFLPWQLFRFAVINLKMLRIIGRGHHQ